MRIIETTEQIGHRAEFQPDGSLAVYQGQADALANAPLYKVFPASRGAEALEDLATHFNRFQFSSHSRHLV